MYLSCCWHEQRPTSTGFHFVRERLTSSHVIRIQYTRASLLIVGFQLKKLQIIDRRNRRRVVGRLLSFLYL